MIDKILLDLVKKDVKGDDVAIFMGGGTDSATLLFTCLRLGKKPVGYSFFLDGKPSYDSLKAEEICKTFNVPFVPVPMSTNNLVEDFKLLAEKYNCRKKTHFECTFPFIYLFPKIKEKYILTGVGADSHYVLSKKGMMHFKHTVELMNKFRYNYFHNTPNAGAMDQLRQFCNEYDKVLSVPYFEKEVYDYFYDKSWEEINKPVQKHLIKKCYKEFDKIKVKPHINYQLCAEIDHLFEKLIDVKEINFKNRKRVMDICRDWYEKNSKQYRSSFTYMILVDLNQVLISNLMAQTRGEFDELPDKNMLRHMVLNSIRGYNLKFKDEYGTPVLCADGANPWRRDIFPNYKYKRKKGRDESDVDWSALFKMIGEIRDEIAENFPYIVLHIDKVEADDIIAVLVKENHIKEKIMIVSGDKDFIQLHRYPNVKQYAPIQKKFVEDEDPVRYLHEQVIKGDRSDGVPNILSADDVFVTGTKQRPINKKRLEEWTNIENIPLGSETKKYYERNKKLIDLDEIPGLIYNDIKSKYINYKVNDRTLLLTYFIENKLKSLIENINDF